MRLFKQGLTIMLVGLVLAGCSLLPLENLGQGALQVTSNQTFSLFLDENLIGQTPFFDEKIKVGEHVLKLVPADGDQTTGWQTKIHIAKRTLTVVNYEAATHPDEASSEVLLLEPLSDDKRARLSISTLPDNVVVKVDGEVSGFSPIILEDISIGEHSLQLESPGYKPKIINIKTNPGHQLVVQAQLAKNLHLATEAQSTIKEATSSSSLENTTATTSATTATFGKVVKGVIIGYSDFKQLKDSYVKILPSSANVDWLRVRSQPNGLADNEIGRVKVGTYFIYKSTSKNNEWYEIVHQEGTTGWISAKYAELTEIESP